ncbi:unnamed protein product [Rotaria sordida]|uniref:Uncharacterized protein n=2 Tax=Rotaria sordida TaxID=392033 RepID=A0A813QA87_9BILA|nr:unnamed protein product [Rotaria sordida]
MTNMAQIETVMFESVTAKTKNLPLCIKQERPKRECRSRKRPYDIEQYSTKRLKYDQIDIDEQDDNSYTFGLTLSDTDDDNNDTESKCSTSDDTEQSSIKQFDDNSDIEENEDDISNIYFSKISSDQHRHIPVVLNQTISQQQQPTFSRYSKRLISQFKYLYDQGLRKAIQPTNSFEFFNNDNNNNNDIYFEKLRWELRNTFNRIDLFKEGYCVLSNEPFPFHSLCYMEKHLKELF